MIFTTIGGLMGLITGGPLGVACTAPIGAALDHAIWGDQPSTKTYARATSADENPTWNSRTERWETDEVISRSQWQDSVDPDFQ